MGVFGKKSVEDRFREALRKGDYSSVLAIGQEILNGKPFDIGVLNEVADAYVALGKRASAVKLLLSFGKRKLDDGFYDTAIAILKKVLKLDSFNREATFLLSNAYTKKDLHYEAFLVVKRLFDRLRRKGTLSDEVRDFYFKKLGKLLDTAEELKSDNVADLLLYFSNLAKDILNADRCSLFLADGKRKVLWTKVAHGVDRIEIPWNKGIAGKAYVDGEPLIVNDAYSSPYFDRDVDRETGYVTKNILAVPVKLEGRSIGVYQAINKKDGFDEEDLSIFQFLANYAAEVLVEKGEVEPPPEGIGPVDPVRLIAAMLTPDVKEVVSRVVSKLEDVERGEGLNLNALRSLIDDLKGVIGAVNLLQARGVEPEEEEEDIFQLLRSILGNYRDISVNLPSESSFVFVDRFLFKEMVRGVLRSSMFRSGGSEISFSLTEKRESADRVSLTFCVEDRGRPIPLPERELVFTYDYSVEKPGGLFVSRQIARLMGGDVWLESNGFTRVFVKVVLRKVRHRITR